MLMYRTLSTDDPILNALQCCNPNDNPNRDADRNPQAELGDAAGAAAEPVDFLPFGNLEQSVRDDINIIKNSPLVDDVPVHGYVYDVATGKVRGNGTFTCCFITCP